MVLPYRGAAARSRSRSRPTPACWTCTCRSTRPAASVPRSTSCRPISRARSCLRSAKRVPSASFGVSKFADFPFGRLGTDGSDGPADIPYLLLTPITSDISAVASAVARLDQPLQNGGDLPEAGAEALWQIATGKGYSGRLDAADRAVRRRPASGGGKAGGVGFREGALRVVLHVTDAPSHQPSDYAGTFPGTHSMAQAGKALHGLGAETDRDRRRRVRGTRMRRAATIPRRTTARAELEQIALTTGAVGPDPVAANARTASMARRSRAATASVRSSST